MTDYVGKAPSPAPSPEQAAPVELALHTPKPPSLLEEENDVTGLIIGSMGSLDDDENEYE